MVRTFKYRLYPTRKQTELLAWTLAECCDLYNAALEERIGAWKTCRKSVTLCEQKSQLVALKRSLPSISGVYSQVLQDVVRRVDKTFKAFFRRGKGYPRYKPGSRYDSFTYPQSGFAICDARLSLAKIGSLKIKLHREPTGTIKTLTIKREGTRWYACFAVECEPEPLPANTATVGLDLGLTSFAVLSDGTEIANPRWERSAAQKVRTAHRRMARRKKFSQRWRKAVAQLAELKRRERNRRSDFHHQLSRQLVNRYGLIAVEDLNVKGLASGMLARSVHDAGWSAFLFKLTYKAESAGRQMMKVDPRGTSQRCVCGEKVPKKLSQRRHDCPACGLSTSRDHASALEILRLGLSRQALTAPLGAVACAA